MQYTPVGDVTLPVDLDMAKDWLRVTHNHEDQKIEAIIKSAFAFAESYTGQTFHPQGWELTASIYDVYGGLLITKAPVSAFGVVKMRRKDGSEIFLTNRDYFLKTDSSRALFFVRSSHLFHDAEESPYAFKINFQTDAGFPPHIENAIKMLIAFMYENAGDAPTINNNNAPPEALLLLQSQRVGFI